MNNQKSQLSRRQFLATTLTATAAASLRIQVKPQPPR